MSLPNSFSGTPRMPVAVRRGIAAMRPAQITQPRDGVSRKAFTDKIGVAEDATDEQALAALDAKLAARNSKPQADPQEALYARVYGA